MTRDDKGVLGMTRDHRDDWDDQDDQGSLRMTAMTRDDQG